MKYAIIDIETDINQKIAKYHAQLTNQTANAYRDNESVIWCYGIKIVDEGTETYRQFFTFCPNDVTKARLDYRIAFNYEYAHTSLHRFTKDENERQKFYQFYKNREAFYRAHNVTQYSSIFVNRKISFYRTSYELVKAALDYLIEQDVGAVFFKGYHGVNGDDSEFDKAISDNIIGHDPNYFEILSKFHDVYEYGDFKPKFQCNFYAHGKCTDEQALFVINGLDKNLADLIKVDIDTSILENL